MMLISAFSARGRPIFSGISNGVDPGSAARPGLLFRRSVRTGFLLHLREAERARSPCAWRRPRASGGLEIPFDKLPDIDSCSPRATLDG